MFKLLGTMSRQATFAAASLGVLAFGGVLASAASLGGVTGSSLGVGVTTVASCDTDGVLLSYDNTFDDTAGTYQVTGVTVLGINAACSGKLITVTLKNGTAAAGTGGTTIPGSTAFVTFSMTGNADAEDVTGAAVVIAD